MMYKKRILLVFIIITFFSTTFFGYCDNSTDKKSLIIYEREKIFRYNENPVNHLNELLYVFNKDVSKISINDYNSGYINNFDYVFVININNKINNTDFLNDLSNFNNKIYWIGDKIENFLDFSGKYNISYDSKKNNITKLFYKNKQISINTSYLFNMVNTSPTTNVIATMSDGYNTYPFILNEKNLYYISNWDLEKSYIFEDSLNDFYEKKNHNEEEVFVRIEDVHLFRDTKKLRKIADYLCKENVPFIIALIPAYTDSKTGKINTLDLKPEFIETIKYMQQKGGSIILHGYTHQIGKEQISGEGYEFWDIKNDKPIKENINNYVKSKVENGVRLCIGNGIYPLGFEAPHYAMNIKGYKEIKKYFSTYIGQYQNNNDNYAVSTFPYTIKDSDAFNVLIPENLGFIDSQNPFTVDLIKENFNKVSMVRGYSGGFFFHPYLDIKYLKECVDYLKENNVQFLDLKEKENYIKIDDISIKSNDGKITHSYDKSKSISVHKEESKFENDIKHINDAVIVFIYVILVLFFIIFIILKIRNKHKFTRR